MASADLDFSARIFDKVEFYIDKRKVAAVALAAIGAGCLIAYPFASRPAPLSGIAGALATAVALTGSAALLAAGLVMLLRLLARRGAALVIDATGIHDRQTGAPLLPWARIHDIRVLDRHGRHIGIETVGDAGEGTAHRRRWLPAMLFPSHGNQITVVDTFFLQSRSGDRILDFVLPLTAVAPIDMSETPVSDDTLSADARLSRRRTASVILFIIAMGIVPAAAAVLAAT